MTVRYSLPESFTSGEGNHWLSSFLSLYCSYLYPYIVMQNSISVKGRSNRSPPILPISITHSEERIFRTSRCTFRTDVKHMSDKEEPVYDANIYGFFFLSLFRSLRARRRIIRRNFKKQFRSCPPVPSPSFCPAPCFFSFLRQFVLLSVLSAAVAPKHYFIRLQGFFLHR